MLKNETKSKGRSSEVCEKREVMDLREGNQREKTTKRGRMCDTRGTFESLL